MAKLATLACLSMLTLALPAPVLANDATADDATVVTADIAGARNAEHRRGFTTYGPDQAGNYKAVVHISDLNLATTDGFTTAQQRVKRAVDFLCRKVTADHEFPGYPASSPHGCMIGNTENMTAQLDEARAAALSGEQPERLSFSEFRKG